MLYEAVILFGVALVPALLSTLIVRTLGPGRLADVLAQVTGFACFGAYFVWVWCRNGQTLPMQTWRIELVRRDGRRLRWPQAIARYTAAWLWVAPAIGAAHLAGWSRWWALGATAAWAVAYGALALLDRDRQFVHDRLCGTRLVQWPR